MNNLEILSTRKGFNSAVRHIKRTIGIVESMASNKNLSDLLTEIEDDEINGEKIGLLLSMLLVDKMGYMSSSVNLESTIDDPSSLSEEFAKWKAVDMIAAYHHPDLGLVIANPKRPEQLAAFGVLRKRELLVIYAGKLEKGGDDSCKKAADLAVKLFEGSKAKVPDELYKGEFTLKKLASKEAEKPKKRSAKKSGSTASKSSGKRTAAAEEKTSTVSIQATRAAAQTAAPAPLARGPRRMTPMYSVVVQNELFHNGNVEAWKRIIESYKTKYPDLEVYIYYDGERIVDINALFKWGKVKHGSTIQFAVAGSDIKDVAKLQRYLNQGASHMFEAFLHGPVSTVLKLF